ncbi:ABC transporter substrate-binding protein [Paramicrobacterium chengjingii]|uniref:ABC transporter substrate-binding protein n=1 Tax=Paramicrobacterium chengjingii TaxID=2769067 RepID=UPI00141DF320|nr:ABC transporter substrate-binding protein [Microbacterium chengjingii]
MMNTRMVRRIALATTAALALTAGLSACSFASDGNSADGTGKVRLAINNTVASLPAVVADERGFFKDEGVDIELTTVTDISKIPATLGKQYDIGFGVQPTLILAASKGIDIVMVSGNAITSEEEPEYVIMARPDAGIKEPKDFVGKNLGSPTLNGNIHTGTLYWLEQNGVDAKSVNSLQVPTATMVDQLEAGLIDAAEMQQPYIEIAREAGMVEAGYALSAVSNPTSMSSWQAERSWAENNLETLKKYRNALDKAIQWISDNDDEARDLLAEFTGLDRNVIGDAPLSTYSTEMSVDSVEQWDAPMRAVTSFNADLDYSSLVVK